MRRKKSLIIRIFGIYFKSVEAEPAITSANVRPGCKPAPAPPRSWHGGFPSSVSLRAQRAGCLCPYHPSGKKKGTPTAVPSPPAHGDDAGSLLSGLSLLEDFGFSKMNLLRRSVSELAWAPAYASPGDKAEGGLAWGDTPWARGAVAPRWGTGTLTSIAGGLGHVLGAGDVMPVGAAGQHGGGGAGVGEVLSALVQQLWRMKGGESDTGCPEPPPSHVPRVGWSSP